MNVLKATMKIHFNVNNAIVNVEIVQYYQLIVQIVKIQKFYSYSKYII
jgi:hypothetical protein